MIKSIKIGTRSSKLALYQSNLVKEKLSSLLPSIKISLVEIKTKGDKILDRNLDRSIDKGFFVKEIQEHLLDDKIVLASPRCKILHNNVEQHWYEADFDTSGLSKIERIKKIAFYIKKRHGALYLSLIHI